MEEITLHDRVDVEAMKTEDSEGCRVWNWFSMGMQFRCRVRDNAEVQAEAADCQEREHVWSAGRSRAGVLRNRTVKQPLAGGAR